MNLCENLNFTGGIVAVTTFFAIGLGFMWVIKLEYYVGAHVAKWVGLIGTLMVISSLFTGSFWISSVVGIFGGTVVWGATELPDQQKRAAHGQFPQNPAKKGKSQ